jgi:hypothetical protein
MIGAQRKARTPLAASANPGSVPPTAARRVCKCWVHTCLGRWAFGCLKLFCEAAIMTTDRQREAPLSDAEPIEFSPRRHAGLPGTGAHAPTAYPSTTSFDRKELNAILNLYGRKVAAGEWRDYAIDFERDKAVFSVFRRTSEVPLYRIEKQPRLARKQGAYSVVAATGLILKRGNELGRVLESLDRKVRLAAI